MDKRTKKYRQQDRYDPLFFWGGPGRIFMDMDDDLEAKVMSGLDVRYFLKCFCKNPSGHPESYELPVALVMARGTFSFIIS